MEEPALFKPDAIMKAGWNFLVDPVMRESGYVRYDEKRSTKVPRCCETLQERYRGSLKRLHAMAADQNDLERRLTDFYGVGPVTADILLLELRPVWTTYDPKPLPVVVALARAYRINLGQFDRRTKAVYPDQSGRIEAGLIRMRTAKDSPLRARPVRA